jgi:hypothetical protein
LFHPPPLLYRLQGHCGIYMSWTAKGTRKPWRPICGISNPAIHATFFPTFTCCSIYMYSFQCLLKKLGEGYSIVWERKERKECTRKKIRLKSPP